MGGLDLVAPGLIRTFARGSASVKSLFLRTDRVRSIDELARREGIDRRSVRRLLPLGFLSPRVVEAIVEGRQPPDLSVMALTRRIDLPLLWSAQEQALGLR
jgi:hypothetical protein